MKCPRCSSMLQTRTIWGVTSKTEIIRCSNMLCGFESTRRTENVQSGRSGEAEEQQA